MKPLLLILIAFIMNACLMQPATEEDMNMSVPKKPSVAWSQSGNLSPGHSNQKVQLQKLFDEPGNYTVQFNISDPAFPRSIVPQATIIWSVKGNSVSRIIDVSNGTSISGTAEAVSVYLADVGAPVAGGNYVGSIQVVKGTRPSVQQPPTLTIDNLQLDAGASNVLFAVPASSGAISLSVTVAPQVVQNAIPEFTVLVQQENSVGTVLKAYDPRISGWIALSPSATAIRLLQGAGAPATNWAATFGIDG